MALQQFIPIYEKSSHRILGAFNLGSNISFDGTETQYTMGNFVINVEKIVPSPSLIHKVNPWYMAAIFPRADIVSEAYRGYPQFVEIDQTNLPFWSVSQTTGAGLQIREVPGLFLQGMEGNFAPTAVQHTVD